MQDLFKYPFHLLILYDTTEAYFFQNYKPILQIYTSHMIWRVTEIEVWIMIA